MLAPFSFMGGGIDPDAQAFINAAGITDPVQINAINTLVLNMKTQGLWSKMKAIYPFVGGTASAHKWNLKDPRDLDAAFRLVFNGGWTHSAQGATPNGTNGYADTNLVPSSVLAQNSASLSLYSRTNNTSLIDRVEMGSSNVTVDIQQAIRWNGTLGNLSRLNNGYIVGTSGYIPTKTSGLFAVSRTSSTITKKYEDGILKETTADPSATPNSFSIYLATRNNSGTAAFFDAKQYAFATIGDGLTDTEAANLYTAVQTFNQTLNRQVGAQIVSDADAQAFINRVYTAGGTLTNTEANAVNQLVIDMKAAGIWTSMRAVYPMVGSSAAACSQNLRSSSFTGTFTSGWTFASTGVTPNGTSAYMDSGFAPNSFTSNNSHLSYYSRTNNSATLSREIGSNNLSSASYNPEYSIRISDLNLGGGTLGDYNIFSSFSTTNSDYFGIMSRVNSTSLKSYKNGVLQDTKTATNTLTSSSLNIYIGATNFGGSASRYSNRQCAFASIGDGLTDTEAANLYTAVQTFQTTLNRQV